LERSEVIKELVKILKANGWRKSATNVHSLVQDNLADIKQSRDSFMHLLDAADEYELWDWRTCKSAYQEVYGKRKKSSKPAKMTTVSVGQLLDETEKAYKFSTGKMTNRGRYPQLAGVWVSKSQVSYNEVLSELEMPVWLAIEKNWMR